MGIRLLQSESVATEERVENASKGLQIMLATAKDSINSLQTLLAQKNESIEQYKAMIDKLLKKLKEQQSKYSAHIVQLKAKYNAALDNQSKNENLQRQPVRDDNTEWIEMSQMKTDLQIKANLIDKLEERNRCLAEEQKANLVKIGVSDARIGEYHIVIQELNAKIKQLSENLSAFKSKFSLKKKENFHLQNAVKSLKTNIESMPSPNAKQNENKNEQMDQQMQKMESEFRILRCSLKSKMDTNKEQFAENQIENKKLTQSNKNLSIEIEKLRQTLTTKSECLHRLQISISKLQKDKITMQEKHSLSLTKNKKKIKNLQAEIEKLQKQMNAKPKESLINKAELSKFRKKANDKANDLKKQLAEQQIKFEKCNELRLDLMEKVNKLEKEKHRRQKNKKQKEEKRIEHASGEQIDCWKEKCDAQTIEIFDLKRQIQIDLNSKIKKLQIECESVRRKYDLVSNGQLDDDKFCNKQLSKLLDEIESNENKICDLETTICELKFERESMEICHSKLQKQIDSKSESKMQICSRNDPELQNLLDSMRFIINKLKKEKFFKKKKKKKKKKS